MPTLDKETLSNIALQATNEHAMEEMLRKMEQTWAHAELEVVPHSSASAASGSTNKDFRDTTWVLAGIEEVNSLLEESQVAVAAMKGSRFVGMSHLVAYIVLILFSAY